MTPPTASVGDRVFTVSAATNSSRNGTYTLTRGARYTSNSPRLNDFGFNGITADGKVEYDVTFTAALDTLQMSVRYIDTYNSGNTFQCGSNALPCIGVSYDPATLKVSIVNTRLGMYVGGGTVNASDTVTVNGTILIGK